MITSRQLRQPQSPLVLEYLLLHNGRNDLPASFRLVSKIPELSDFYEVDIR
ncbi:hypothetical protein I8751_06675 [Nostocaceae cyanobacterium CENA357]|uniref:Uncharacterized protein n=1 Tax=Atlanticothrix silvestris CENA357 TaxID=1725252 RepID=A0A8J7H9L4_9CYAN|nr:hypothetical protein [Atlanticothrix silvestris CENA357]